MANDLSESQVLHGRALTDRSRQLTELQADRDGVTSSTVSVVLADDHAMIREGLRLVLRHNADIAVVGEAEDGPCALRVASRLGPDVVVLDLEMPNTDPLVLLREFGETLPGVRVLILTMHTEDARLVPLLEAGAHGYLTKEAASSELADAIRAVAAGEVYVRPHALRLLASAVVPRRTTDTANGRFKTLSDRERIVLRMVAQGFNGVEIARHLQLSTKTVEAYKRRIEEKLGFEHRTHYVSFAIAAGILVP